jgi:hypothetical protein
MGRSWTTEVGHSTKACPGDDLGSRVAAALSAGGNVVELSVPDVAVLAAVPSARGLARRSFRRVSVHAGAALSELPEDELVASLNSFDVPVVADAHLLVSHDHWRVLGGRLLIQNGDDTATRGRTAAELHALFDALPDARFCLDISHALRAGGRGLVDELTAAFGRRIAEIHAGCPGGTEVDSRLEPELLDAVDAVVADLGRPVPVIIERPGSQTTALSHVYAVRVAIVDGVEHAAAA